MNNLIKVINGVPMVSTITIANECRNGKTNNVYRMAARLAILGKITAIDYKTRPAEYWMDEESFRILATRFCRQKDIATAEGITRILAAFEGVMNTVIDDVQDSTPSAEHAQVKPTTPNENDEINAIVTSKMAAFIAETTNRVNHMMTTTFDAMRDMVSDIMVEVRDKFTDKVDECNALRDELDAIKRMLKPEPVDQVEPMAGNVSVQQCAAWLTSKGITDMGEIRLYSWMRDNGLVCSVGTSRNLPTQIALEKGLLVSVSNPYRNPHTGTLVNSFTTRVTPKGQSYLFNRLMYYQINGTK